jgi:hypothetical protein
MVDLISLADHHWDIYQPRPTIMHIIQHTSRGHVPRQINETPADNLDNLSNTSK